jgi:hypothetical protein
VGRIREKCQLFTPYQNLNKILIFRSYNYCVVMRGLDFVETKLPFPIVTALGFSAGSLVPLCPRVAVAANRNSCPGNYKNLGFKACEMPKPKSSSLNPKRR